jgi:hypothetical protein
MVGPCKHGNEASSSIKGRKFLREISGSHGSEYEDDSFPGHRYFLD